MSQEPTDDLDREVSTLCAEHERTDDLRKRERVYLDAMKVEASEGHARGAAGLKVAEALQALAEALDWPDATLADMAEVVSQMFPRESPK